MKGPEVWWLITAAVATLEVDYMVVDILVVVAVGDATSMMVHAKSAQHMKWLVDDQEHERNGWRDAVAGWMASRGSCPRFVKWGNNRKFRLTASFRELPIQFISTIQ